MAFRFKKEGREGRERRRQVQSQGRKGLGYARGVFPTIESVGLTREADSVELKQRVVAGSKSAGIC